LTKEKKYLENQLEIEKTKVETDSKRFQALLNEYNSERVGFFFNLKRGLSKK
jgi:hypothetical protein